MPKLTIRNLDEEVVERWKKRASRHHRSLECEGRGYLGEGAAIATAMIPFLLAAILVSWFGLQKRKWQQGTEND